MNNNELLKQVEKSIFNKDTNTSTSNPRLLTNKNKTIQNEIIGGFQ